MSGAFSRQGLSYKVTAGWLNNIVTTFEGRELHYDTAAMRLFDIKRREADFLFRPGSYDAPMKGAAGERCVAKRIRDFVAGKVSPNRADARRAVA